MVTRILCKEIGQASCKLCLNVEVLLLLTLYNKTVKEKLMLINLDFIRLWANRHHLLLLSLRLSHELNLETCKKSYSEVEIKCAE
jgi:hypothetical protein